MNKLHFMKATPPPALVWQTWGWLPLFIGILNVGMALTQLVKFEDFVRILESYGWTSGAETIFLAVIITTFEILSLPVLLRLTVSKAARWLSIVAAVGAPALWIGIIFSALLTEKDIQDNGLLGGLVSYPFNWWSLVVTKIVLLLTLLALYVLGYVRYSKSDSRPGFSKR